MKSSEAVEVLKFSGFSTQLQFNLGQNSLGKCNALICLCDKESILPTFPPPPIPMLF